VFVLTSHMEANPVSILEAMATGKPVIAPRVGSIPESVAEGETGYLFEPGDLSILSQRLLECLTNSQRATEMGDAGRSVVETNWSLNRMVSGYEELIEALYDRRCAGSHGSLEAYATDSSNSAAASVAVGAD
jgi:glycosyltransferase involved in cell wall biosynthesis